MTSPEQDGSDRIRLFCLYFYAVGGSADAAAIFVYAFGSNRNRFKGTTTLCRFPPAVGAFDWSPDDVKEAVNKTKL